MVEHKDELVLATEAADSQLMAAAARGDAAGIKEVHDKAGALQQLLREAAKKHKNLGEKLKKLNELARVRILAAQEMGALLLEVIRRGGPRYRGRTLDELGISRNQSSKWQKMAGLPDMLRAYIELCDKRSEEASIAGYMRFAKNEPHFSSELVEWLTPPHIVEACAKVLGKIELDPCSNLGEPNVPAGAHYTLDDDGLSKSWKGSVFMNPPYGRQLRLWVRKLWKEWRDGDVTEGIALLPARPGSDWFEEVSDAPVCFLRGRLRFNGGSPAPFSSMCVYVGADAGRFFEMLGAHGCGYRPVFRRAGPWALSHVGPDAHTQGVGLRPTDRVE